MVELMSAQWVHELIRAYGLWVLFAVVMLESTGVPMPGETVLVTAALYAGSTHGFGISSVILVAAAGAIGGDNLGYLIGRSVGMTLLTRYGSYIHLNEGRLQVGQYLFLRHGGKIVFFGRFVALLRAFAALLAGANRMPWPRFLTMNALGGLAWAGVFGGGAYLFGERMRHVAGPVSLVILAVALGLVVAGALFFRHHEKALEIRARAALEAEKAA